jgi:replicative DNA helicase
MNAPAFPIISNADQRFDTEAGMLGSIISFGSPEAYRVASELIGPEHFSDAFHARLFSLVGRLVGEGLSGFKLTQRIMHELQGDKTLLDAGLSPTALVAKLASKASPPIGVEGDARQIKYDWLKERLKEAVDDEENSEAEEIAAEMDGLSKSHLDRSKSRVGALTAMDTVLTRLNVSLTDKTPADDVAFPGSRTLAHVIGGWRRKRFYVIGGRPGMGKTTVGLSWLLRTAGKGHNVLFFSLEMDATELSERALSDISWAASARIEYKDISRNSLGPAGVEHLYSAHRRLQNLPLVIDDRAGLTLAQVRAACLQEKQRLEGTGKTLDVVCIDHMGLMRASERYAGNKVAETEELSGQLKVMAKELDVAVIALMQLNRGVEGREDKRPSLADLRWSGAIEQDADVVMFCYREAYYLQNRKCDNDADESDRLMRLGQVKDRLEIIVAKQRGGECPIMDFYCDMGCAAVRDLEVPR